MSSNKSLTNNVAGSITIYSDLNELAETATLQQAAKSVQHAHANGITIGFAVLDLPPVASNTGDQHVQAAHKQIAARVQNTKRILNSVADLIIDVPNLGALPEVFSRLVQEASKKAASMYELAVCVSPKAGIHTLTVKLYGINGSFTVTYNATGFAFGLTCGERKKPNTQPMKCFQTSQSRMCSENVCGFNNGVFCGFCQ